MWLRLLTAKRKYSHKNFVEQKQPSCKHDAVGAFVCFTTENTPNFSLQQKAAAIAAAQLLTNDDVRTPPIPARAAHGLHRVGPGQWGVGPALVAEPVPEVLLAWWRMLSRVP